jgi:hypothetical protein
MDEVITRRIIKPCDCVVAFGIPTSLEGFRRARENPANRDFVINRCPDARDYQRQIISYTDKLLPVMTALGASVVRDLTLDGFKTLFSQDPPVIILFAHWDADSIEFADGLASIEDVINAVPIEYGGIIDLCVCHPKKLALELRRLRKNCVVKFAEGRTTASFWLYFYVVLFKKLLSSRMTYLNAVSDTIVNFQDNFRPQSCSDYKRSLRRFFSKRVS